MATRIFLGLSALLWLPYGIFCFFQPAYLAEAAGVASNSLTGTIELRAMYGGLQAGIGLLALLALFRPALQVPALVTLAFLCSGLALARVSGTILAAELSLYTALGLTLEIGSLSFAWWLLSRSPARAV